MTVGHIKWVKTADLGEVLHSLVSKGLTFNVTPEVDGTWDIELTGGY
jgi:hypothetical protein